MTLGDLIRTYREQHNLSMDEFAKRAQLTRPYVWMLEKNKNTKNNKPIIPSVTTLKKVASAVNMTLGALLEILDDNYPVRLETRINVTSQELEHIEKYRALTEEHKEDIDTQLNHLYEKDTANFVKKESPSFGQGESDAG